MEIKTVYDIFHLVYWEWRVVLDLFLGGLGVGAFIYAICIMFYKKDDQLVSVKIGAILGPLAMTLGLILLLTEMGQPARIYKTITRFNLTSTQSWGGIIQEGFILFSGFFAVLLIMNKNKQFRNKVAIFAGFFAVFAAYYHGFLLSFVTARPLWNNGASSVVQVLLSINTGVASVLLLASLSKRGREEIREMNNLIKGTFLILQISILCTCFLWVMSLIHGNASFVNAYHVLNKNYGVIFWVGAVLVGLILPFIIVVSRSFGEKKDKFIPITLVAVPILIGGLIFRYVLILAGQMS